MPSQRQREIKVQKLRDKLSDSAEIIRILRSAVRSAKNTVAPFKSTLLLPAIISI